MEKNLFPRVVLIAVLAALLMFSCDNPTSSDKDDGNGLLPTDSGPFAEVAFQLNNFYMTVDSTGTLSHGLLHEYGDEDNASVLFLGGLWLGAVTPSGPKADIVWTGSQVKSNYTAVWPDKMRGVYFFDSSLLENLDAESTTDLGLPANCYGDAMCWSVLKPIIGGDAIYAEPLTDLSVTQALYGYQRQDLENVMFVRYQICNLDNSVLNELYSGFFADIDLHTSVMPPTSGHNATGYDLNRDLTYTYNPGFPGPTFVTGFTVLETPLGTNPNAIVESHRIMRKNNYIDPDFGEIDFNSSQQVVYALQGLSNTGQPMIDPTTEAQTQFAFTGDPVAGTGWLDTPVDVRSLMGFCPFSLAANETGVLTIAMVVATGNDLSAALQALKTKVDDIRNEPGLWQFN